jgi:hypothetical protein
MRMPASTKVSMVGVLPGFCSAAPVGELPAERLLVEERLARLLDARPDRSQALSEGFPRGRGWRRRRLQGGLRDDPFGEAKAVGERERTDVLLIYLADVHGVQSIAPRWPDEPASSC